MGGSLGEKRGHVVYGWRGRKRDAQGGRKWENILQSKSTNRWELGLKGAAGGKFGPPCPQPVLILNPR